MVASCRIDSDKVALIGASMGGWAALMTAARHDVLGAAVHHVPLTKALRDANAQQLIERVFETDHAFSDHRVKLAQTILDWLPQTYARSNTAVSSPT
jgi:S-formylglutathione hydrolase FrmB